MGVANNYTQLFLYFLHLFNNFIQLVPILFTPVQLCTFLKIFGKIFITSCSLKLGSRYKSLLDENYFHHTNKSLPGD